MKILHCTNFYTPTSGGVKTYLHAVGGELIERGLPFRLVVPGREDRLEEDPRRDMRIYTLKSPRFPVNRDYRMILPLDFLPWFRFRLGRIIESERPDVVEVSDLWTLIHMARALKHRPAWFGLEKRPLVAGFAHDRLTDYVLHYFKEGTTRRVVLGFSHWYLRRVYLPSFDLILTNSRYTEAELGLHRGTGQDSGKPETRVVPLGVDLGAFSPERKSEEFRRVHLGEGEDFLLLYAGRLAREKGLDRLLAAMGELLEQGERRVKLLVIGDGDLRGWIEHQGLGNVSLLGHMGEKERLAAAYASSDAFITPSVREGFGIAQLEAMASGLPVICTDMSGHMSFMGERAGIVTGKEPGELAHAILEMMRLPYEIRRDMGKAARAIAEHFSWRKTTERILDIYTEALGRLHGEVGESSRAALREPSHEDASCALGVDRCRY
jgi:alpha-1,6-mannosyltransferase